MLRAVVLAVAFVVALPAPARAHAIVRETTPAVDAVVPTSPAAVVMRFNEPVEATFGAIRVFAGNGRRVDEGPTRHRGDTVEVSLEDDLPNGTYTVGWRVVSGDGHPIEEAFTFSVGAPGMAFDVNEAGEGRLGWAAGVARWMLFAALLLLGGAVAWGRSWWAPAVVAAAATAVGFVLQGAVAAQVGIVEAVSFSGDVAGTRYGRWALVRLAVLGVAALVRRRVAAGVLAVAAFATVSLSGHAGADPVDVVHMAAAAVWVGGLPFVWGKSREVMARFSRVATVAVGVLVVTGVVRSWVELDAVDSRYGRLLLAKVVLVVAMVALGWWNRRRLDGDVRRTMAAEIVLGLVVLAVTATLVTTPPTVDADPRNYHVTLGPGAARVMIDEDEVHVMVVGFDPEAVQLLFRMPERGIGPLVAEAERHGPGLFVVSAHHLSVTGRWDLEVVARLGRFDEARARVTVDID